MGFIKQVVKQTAFSFSKCVLFCIQFCVCVCVCAFVWGKYTRVQTLTEARRGHQFTGRWSFRKLWAQLVLVLRTKLWFSAGVLPAFNCWAISPACLLHLYFINKHSDGLLTFLLVWAQGGASELHWIIFCFLSYHNCKKYTKDI